MQSVWKLIKGVNPKKCLAYGVIVGTSAVTQQELVTPLASGKPIASGEMDKGFVGRCFVLGACWLGPSVMIYQQLAERTFPGEPDVILVVKLIYHEASVGEIPCPVPSCGMESRTGRHTCTPN